MDSITFLKEALNARAELEIKTFKKHKSIKKKNIKHAKFLSSTEEKFLEIKNKYCSEKVKFGGIGITNEPELTLANIEISIDYKKGSITRLKVLPHNSLTYYLFSVKYFKKVWKIYRIDLVRADNGKKTRWSF